MDGPYVVLANRWTVADRRLDVRSLPTWDRHAKIMAAFDALHGHEALIVVVDHQPRPLRAEFESGRANQFVWVQRRLAEAYWEVTLRHVRHRIDDSSVVALLKRTIFSDVSSETQRALAAVATERSLDDGTAVVEQDAHWPYLGLVRNGTLAAIVGSRAGRDQVLFEVAALETFAEVETLDGGRTIARIVATSPGTGVILIPSGVVLSCTATDPEFARVLAIACAQRTRAVADRLSSFVARSTTTRIAAAILTYARPELGLTPSLPGLRRMTQSQLAITAGTVKEVVARAIAELEAAGALERERGRIARVDRAKLTALIDADV